MLSMLVKVLVKVHGRVWDEGDQQPYLQNKIFVNKGSFEYFSRSNLRLIKGHTIDFLGQVHSQNV